MKKIHCYCGTSFEINIEDKIDLEKTPEIINQILDNSFMNFKCPTCKKLLRPEYRISFFNKNLDLLMIPEYERDSLLAGTIKLETNQVVVGYKELQEKFLILTFSYDDRIIELIKLYILKKINTELELRIILSDVKNNNLTFHIYGLKENETGISQIPDHIYNSINNNLNERLNHPVVSEILKLPYRSVNKIRTEVL